MARKRLASQGKCELCGGVFDKAAMTNHLKSCRRRYAAATTTEKASKKKTAFHLLVEGRYLPEYWLHLDVPADVTLGRLDQFLRDIWLECCGHMSAFEIDGTTYSVAPMDSDEEPLDVRLKDVLAPRVKFSHEYDFGSTTHLVLKVVAENESDLKKNEIKVLARNEPPAIPCGRCGKPAAQICMECAYSPEGWLCEECATKHGCGEEMQLPVVNSPRVGVCGYTG
jgi:hypothetical protein